MYKKVASKQNCIVALVCVAVFLCLINLILRQTVLAQTTEEMVHFDVYLEQSQVGDGDNVKVLIWISNESNVPLKAVKLELQNELLDWEAPNVPDIISPAQNISLSGSVTPTVSGDFTLLPVLSYTTTLSTNEVMILPKELPVLEVTSPPSFWRSFADFPRELASLLIGVLVGLISVGLTSLVNYWIVQNRQKWEALEMLQAAVRTTIEVLGMPAAGPVPSDTLDRACSSPNYERLLWPCARY
jgi:hypothetical protein